MNIIAVISTVIRKKPPLILGAVNIIQAATIT
jgi:hypothetical protein